MTVVIKRLFDYGRSVARPVNADAAATRARILAVASVLFAERGAGQVSIRAIAKDAGVSLAMVHHYFGSKDDLYAACVDSMYTQLAELRGTIEAALLSGLGAQPKLHLVSHGAAPPTTPRTAIDRAVRTCYRFALEHENQLRLVMRTVIDEGEIPAERRDEVLIPFLAQAGPLFATGRPLTATRLALQSVVFLIVRFALSSNDELLVIAGGGTKKSIHTLVEDHLVASAIALLGIVETADD